MAKSDSVVIGCRLPNGIVLELPSNPAKKVEISGLNKAVIIGADYVTTTVDAGFWSEFSAANKDFAPLKNGAIFVANSEADAKAIAKDFAEVKTGFEPVKQDDAGVKPANKD